MSDFEKLIEAAKHGDLETATAIVRNHPELTRERDEEGATPLHHAAFGGHRMVVRLLVEHGAEINAPDAEFGATPAGWAIEYLREMGGFLGIELDDFAHAIKQGDVEWTTRFLRRFPGLRNGKDTRGNSFKLMADQSGNADIAKLFESDTA
jgi:ankyrin repeat protein